MGPGEDNEVRDRQKDRASIAQLIALGVVASILGIVLGLLIDWFPTQASTQADPVDTLWDVLVIASVPMFVIVVAVVLYCVWKFRMRPGQELLDGPPIHGNTRLEIIWTLIPSILILALCSYAYVVLTDIEEAQANEMRINVVGQQFAWTFEYPSKGGDPVRSTQLYLPEDQPVRFFIRSEDVIHDFWVPAFRMKIDAVPGVVTDYRVTPTRKGAYPVVCAELCGLGHAYMRQTARVVSREDFDRRMQELRGGAGGASDAAGQAGQGGGDAADGKAVFTESNCGGCHTLSDAGASGTTGPNLDDTLEGQSADEIRKSIVDPGADIAEGFQPNIMPGVYKDLPPAQLDALVDYLEEATR